VQKLREEACKWLESNLPSSSSSESGALVQPAALVLTYEGRVLGDDDDEKSFSEGVDG
jgi:hypothetical protein